MPYFFKVIFAATALLSAWPAQAYLGPGLGAGTLGVILGLLGSVLLALFAFFWYPIKRALFGKKSAKEQDEDDMALQEEAAAEEEKTE